MKEERLKGLVFLVVGLVILLLHYYINFTMRPMPMELGIFSYVLGFAGIFLIWYGLNRIFTKKRG